MLQMLERAAGGARGHRLGGVTPCTPHAAGPCTEGATRVIAVRHGETAWNAALRIQGHTDIELNERGRWQAAQLAQALADEAGARRLQQRPAARARDGAGLAAGAGLAVQRRAGAARAPFRPLRRPDLRRDRAPASPDDAARWRRREPDFAPGDGESLRDFHRRCVDACAALAARHRGQTILVVAHGGVLDCLYRAATRTSVDAPRSWQLGNATVNRLLHTDAGFTLVGWNDDQHLAGGGP
jgi:probable phosphoglycerate mutase